MNKLDKAYFAKTLRKMREERFFSIKDVSIALNISPSIIRAYESESQKLPSLETFFQICEFLKINPNQLLKPLKQEKKVISGAEVRVIIAKSGYKLWQIAMVAELDPSTISRRCGCTDFGQENYNKVINAIKKLKEAEAQDV